MIDPSKLVAATRDVYGVEAATAMYGDILPVAAERVIEATDGSTVDLAGRTLTFHDTPGHARHHNCIHDSATGHLFTGDMFGLSYRELDRDGRQFVFPATTPTQFDPEAFHASIGRMLALQPEALYLTHYGKVDDVPRIASDLLRLVDAHAALGRRCATIDDPQAAQRRVACRRPGDRGRRGAPPVVGCAGRRDRRRARDGHPAQRRRSRIMDRERGRAGPAPRRGMTTMLRAALLGATAALVVSSTAVAADLTLLCAGAMKAPVTALLAKRSPSCRTWWRPSRPRA